ncbi:colanic acid biosynthesis glycosyltransferase WcaE [Cryobacterium melibiosiphilum]|uniref:Colanic acid biosynthesis glycosyltransferase WcaE n=1 Tax=Cryobacterium melibiosiphilum TaxID=995039 RepID=A0A3A5MYB3_9MICO|nr:glycosyltransferase [Cryobacterium melibiosiphilum]RJT91026.1 colanic acid biosynthesis glycosyltransferase WcaE [Cryobacterium melibiosiphilum]
MNTTPLLSIVTVTYQDLPGLDRTLRSLKNLAAVAGPDLEVVVIDGGSGPAAHEAIAEMLATTVAGRARVRLVSEPDKGIYDAMNKGLRLTTGAHVWFLNGGDECCLASWSGLKAQFDSSQQRMLLADYLLDTGRGQIHRKARGGSYIWHGLPTSHQAIFYPGEQARESGYDLTYRIVGDYEFTARMIADGIPTQNWYEPVAVFHAGGVSQANTHLLAREAAQVQREILHSPFPRRLLSQARHFISRNLRAFQTRHALADPVPAASPPSALAKFSAGRAKNLAGRAAGPLLAGVSRPPQVDPQTQPPRSPQ